MFEIYIILSLFCFLNQVNWTFGSEDMVITSEGYFLNFTTKLINKGATIFFGIGGVINFRKYLGNIFVTPLFDDQKFYDPHPELQC